MEDKREHVVIDAVEPAVIVGHVIVAVPKGEDEDVGRKRKETGECVVERNGEEENVRGRPEMPLKENDGDQRIQDG